MEHISTEFVRFIVAAVQNVRGNFCDSNDNNSYENIFHLRKTELLKYNIYIKDTEK